MSTADKTVKPTPENVKVPTSENTPPPPITDNRVFDSIFNESNLNVIFLFLAVYFIIVLFLAVFFRDTLASFSIFTGQVVDVLVFGTIIYYAFLKFNGVQKDEMLSSFTQELRRELDDFNTVMYMGIVLVGLQLFTYIFKFITMSGEAPISINMVSAIAWIYMIILLIVNLLTRVFNIPIVDHIVAMFGKVEKKADEVDAVPVAEKKDEVFNVSNNLYTYDDAQNVCSTFGARLATYDDIEDAYNKGAEWCNYGWSEGQMAYFPTQKDTWSSLQKSKKNANSCGRPGINGGYIVNPNVKFGVNCFGKKPEPKPSELMRMQQRQTGPLNGEGQAELDAKVQYWRDHMDTMLTVNPYSKNKWSAY